MHSKKRERGSIGLLLAAILLLTAAVVASAALVLSYRGEKIYTGAKLVCTPMVVQSA